MPDTLLHWHCGGTTYSVKRMSDETGYLIITGPDGIARRGRRPIPVSLVDAWKSLDTSERCQHAEGEIERREKDRATGT